MTIESLEKDINSKELNALYLFFGEERFLLDSVVKKIKKKFGELLQGINYILIDENTVDELIYDIESPAFGFDKKLIIVKNSGLFKKDGRKKSGTPLQNKISNFIVENIETIRENVCLIFIENEADKNEVYNAIDKYGVVCNFEELNEASLIKRLKQIANLYNVNVQENVLSYLIQVCGTNMQFLINEIRKLIEYAGNGGTITKEAIDKLSIKQINSVIFDLTDNLGNKNTSSALEVLDGLISNKEPLQKILVYLYGHFKKLYLCKIAMKTNKDISTSIGLKPNQTFLINKYKKQANSFDEKNLRNVLKEFLNLDYNSKIGNIDLEIGLKGIISTL